MATKNFSADAVLTVVTGIRLAEIGSIGDVLKWMSGESVFTHQIPRVGEEASSALIAMYPDLAEAKAEAEQVTPDNWREWLAKWTERYGATIAVPQMTIAEHERIDPLSELAEKMHPDRIITI